NPLWRCSGTLVSPTHFLTAGHCTESPAAHAEIWFDADVESGIPGNGYPFSGDVGGTPYTHPSYDPNAFYRHDVGMVVLDAPVSMPAYGALPPLNVIDQMARARGTQNVTFTAVGYGLQWSNPVFVEGQRVRMLATPRLVQINTGYLGSYSADALQQRLYRRHVLGRLGGPQLHRLQQRGGRGDVVRHQRQLRRDGRGVPARPRRRPRLAVDRVRAHALEPPARNLAGGPTATRQDDARRGGATAAPPLLDSPTRRAR
ncbi:MAG TPA: trypsin-like serine protease, partial [Gemmatimonadaceae bacterium]|nr:trypsin-like serine protease [Gemmatimonadaceae bacterium]